MKRRSGERVVVTNDDGGDIRRPVPRGGRMPRAERVRRNTEALVADFGRLIQRFEDRPGWPGPSLSFHARAIEVRRENDSVATLFASDRFLEYVYAVLPAWGMHRMGNQAAKVCDFEHFARARREREVEIDSLWERRITALSSEETSGIAEQLWEIIAHLRVSTSETQIVAGSKALHHVLPDLIPPIDRGYTTRFFVGQTQVPFGDRRAFL